MRTQIPPGMTLLSDEIVEQHIHAGRIGRFAKQRLELPGEHGLALVRKFLPEGPRLPPVVLVHGLAQNRYTWHLSGRSMANWLAEQGWDVYNLELRGHGNSRSMEMSEGESFADYVDDVQRVAESLGGSAFWIGHSLGGAACYAAATRVPMAGVVGIGALFSFAQHNWMLMALARITHGMQQGISEHLSLRTRALGRVLARLYAVSDVAGYTFPISGWWPGSIEVELLQERLRSGFDWTSMQVWLDMCRWAVQDDFEYQDAWSALDLPVLVLAGDEDHLMPPGDAKVAYDRSGSSDRSWLVFNHYDHDVHWGHLDLVVGRDAPRFVWPTVHDWMKSRC